ncbi:MAG: deoxycytidylate deaminase [Proteobacteria bacterium]|nr:deoxycytidylate deaminase [Pseudomonadota bacterium]NBP15619.1 deoxycytidylate deaminase [bacterium]
MPRISWEEHALLLAWAATLRSEDPYMKVGASALGVHNEVLGVAYNGLAPGKIVSDNFWVDRNKRRPYMVHAEANLLARIKTNEAKIMAVTLQPCSCCAQSIVAHGIKKVVYTEKYDFDKGGIDILKFYEVDTICIPKEHILSKLKAL